MEKINEWKKKYVIVFCFAVILLEYLFEYLFGGVLVRILKFFIPISKSTNFGYMIMELIVLVVAVCMLCLTGQKHILRSPKKSFRKSLWSGMVFFVLGILGCMVFFSQGKAEGLAFKPLGEIIAFVIFVIFVGLAEEIMYRGIIADSIFERFGNSPLGVVLSILLGGCLFGLIHITNVFSGQSLEETVIQMIATSMLGILLTAIYIKHRNVYGVAVLHTVLDFMTMFSRGFFEGNTLQYQYADIDFWASLRQSLISQSVFVIVAIFVMRPAVVKRIVAGRRDGSCPV